MSEQALTALDEIRIQEDLRIAEISDADLRAAALDENAHVCDCCHLFRGIEFFGSAWLCPECLEKALRDPR